MSQPFTHPTWASMSHSLVPCIRQTPEICKAGDSAPIPQPYPNFPGLTVINPLIAACATLLPERHRGNMETGVQLVWSTSRCCSVGLTGDWGWSGLTMVARLRQRGFLGDLCLGDLWTELNCVCCHCYSVTQLCLTLCNPMNSSTPGFPVLHYLLEFAQTHVHWVGDAI